MGPVGRMIGALAVWLTGPSISGFLIAWAGAELLCAVAYWYLALKTIRERTGRLSGRRFLTARHDQPEILRYLVATNISRSEESRVGKECVSPCRSRWSPFHYKKKRN